MVVGALTKSTKGCVKAAFSDADNFSVIFPKGYTAPARALLMVSTLFMDYMFFEDNKKGD